MVDLLRGLALCGMIVFHVDWDLAFLHLGGVDPSSDAVWTLFGHLVASVFLVLSGISLVLAVPHGLAAARRRLILIAAAASLVTLATDLMFPEEVIAFGILHCIAVADALALAVLSAPVAVILGVALLMVGAPALLASHRLDGSAAVWLGLALTPPHTLDFRPLLPWGGFVFLGVGLARLIPLGHLPQPAGRIPRLLARAGRRSLLVYLLHQPVALGVLLPISLVLPQVPMNLSAFAQSCRRDCVAAGAKAALCEGACGCVLARLSARPAPRPDPQLLKALSRTCLPDERPPVAPPAKPP